MLLYLWLKVIHKTDELNKVNVLKLPFSKIKKKRILFIINWAVPLSLCQAFP